MSIVDWLSQATFNACGVEQLPPDPSVHLTTLDWMEQSALGACVAQSPAGYYIMLGFHAVGLAMIVGVMMVISMRLFGLLRGISAAGLPKFITLGWWGFWINAVSGVAIFFSEANKMAYYLYFWVKIALVFAGIASLAIMNRTLLRPALSDVSKLEGRSAKVQGAIAVIIWLAVIIVGRMLAYLTEFTG
jgi:hypothetical protein